MTPTCPECKSSAWVAEGPEAGYWICHRCGERGSGRTDPIWWRNDPESAWYVGEDE